MLKKIAVVLFLSLGVLQGCASIGELPRDPTKTECLGSIEARVQCGVDNANALISAATKTVTEAFLEGSMDRDEAWKYSYELERAAGYVDEAERLLVLKKTLDAQSKLELAHKVISIIESELVNLSKE